jgi:hypothetical protein
MKGKTLITTFIIALLGALIGLFVYTRFLDKDRLVRGNEEKERMEENARYTSLIPQSGVNDFTFAYRSRSGSRKNQDHSKFIISEPTV